MNNMIKIFIGTSIICLVYFCGCNEINNQDKKSYKKPDLYLLEAAYDSQTQKLKLKIKIDNNTNRTFYVFRELKPSLLNFHSPKKGKGSELIWRHFYIICPKNIDLKDIIAISPGSICVRTVDVNIKDVSSSELKKIEFVPYIGNSVEDFINHNHDFELENFISARRIDDERDLYRFESAE